MKPTRTILQEIKAHQKEINNIKKKIEKDPNHRETYERKMCDLFLVIEELKEQL